MEQFECSIRTLFLIASHPWHFSGTGLRKKAGKHGKTTERPHTGQSLAAWAKNQEDKAAHHSFKRTSKIALGRKHLVST